MKYLILLMLCASFAGVKAQGDLTALLSTSTTSVSEQSEDSKRLKVFMDGISTSSPNELKQLKKIFRGLHSAFLKQYNAHSDFNEIFTTGKYDCLTATALFCNVLDQFHYAYNIMETNYHIFLIVKTSKGEVMIESTDAIGGLIVNKRMIQERISEYRKNIPVASSNGYVFQYPFNLYQKISKNNLNGLLFFNQAVKAYNRQDWESCAVLLEKANAHYASPRCRALRSLLDQTITLSSLNEKTKAD